MPDRRGGPAAQDMAADVRDSMGPLTRRPRSGMDSRVKPEDDEVEGRAASSGWVGEAVRSLPARSDEKFVPVRVGFLDQLDLPLPRPAFE